MYTPGTPDNDDFIAFLIPAWPPLSLYLARKTAALRRLSPRIPPRTDEEWKHVAGIRFNRIRENGSVDVTVHHLVELSRVREFVVLAMSGGLR